MDADVSVVLEEKPQMVVPECNTTIPPEIDPNVRFIVNKLCDDVARSEQDDKNELIEVTTSEGLKLKAKKLHVELAKQFGFNAFSYICIGPPTLPTVNNRSKDSQKRRKNANLSDNESSCNESLKSKPKKAREEKSSLNSSSKQLRDSHKSKKLSKPTASAVVSGVSAFNPSYEIPTKRRDNQKASTSRVEDDSRDRVRKAFSDQITTRCSFHDIDITEKRAKELSFQVEYDLLEFIKSVRDTRYRDWCRAFLKFIINSGKVFLDKLLNATVTTSRLVRIPHSLLDSELQRMDEIEPAVTNSAVIETVVKQTTTVLTTQPILDNNDLTKPKAAAQPSFPFKRRIDRLKPVAAKPIEAGRSAIDDILGGGTDTTSKHMSHLYDANCEICKRNSQLETAMMEKVKKNKQEKEKERETRPRRVSPEQDFATPDPIDDDSAWSKPSISSKTRESRSHNSSSRDRKRSTHTEREIKNDVRKKRRESRWERSERSQRTPEPESVQMSDPREEIVWTGLLDYPNTLHFNCEFSLVKNKLGAAELQKILPAIMKIQGYIDSDTVWAYLDSLRNAWNKEVITLLMHPPIDDEGYTDYVTFYQHMQMKGRMTVVDVQNCGELKDVYLFAQLPNTNLHQSCNVGLGPGLLPEVRKSGNILAVVVRHSAVRAVGSFDSAKSIEKREPLNEKSIGRFASDVKPAREPFFVDIPIVEKSPFDNSPGSFNSFLQKDSVIDKNPAYENSSFKAGLPFNEQPFNVSLSDSVSDQLTVRNNHAVVETTNTLHTEKQLYEHLEIDSRIEDKLDLSQVNAEDHVLESLVDLPKPPPFPDFDIPPPPPVSSPPLEYPLEEEQQIHFHQEIQESRPFVPAMIPNLMPVRMRARVPLPPNVRMIPMRMPNAVGRPGFTPTLFNGRRAMPNQRPILGSGANAIPMQARPRGMVRWNGNGTPPRGPPMQNHMMPPLNHFALRVPNQQPGLRQPHYLLGNRPNTFDAPNHQPIVRQQQIPQPGQPNFHQFSQFRRGFPPQHVQANQFGKRI